MAMRVIGLVLCSLTATGALVASTSTRPASTFFATRTVARLPPVRLQSGGDLELSKLGVELTPQQYEYEGTPQTREVLLKTKFT